MPQPCFELTNEIGLRRRLLARSLLPTTLNRPCPMKLRALAPRVRKEETGTVLFLVWHRKSPLEASANGAARSSVVASGAHTGSAAGSPIQPLCCRHHRSASFRQRPAGVRGFSNGGQRTRASPTRAKVNRSRGRPETAHRPSHEVRNAGRARPPLCCKARGDSRGNGRGGRARWRVRPRPQTRGTNTIDQAPLRVRHSPCAN
jgi:hypothetical protein